MPDVKKKPRKISCLPCRTKKARCDEQHPYCSRCIRNNREHLCIYPKPKTFGRPPKNAVFQKNKDITTAVKPTTSSPDKPTQFIFENQVGESSSQSPPAELISRDTMHAPQRFIKYNNQQLDIERIYSLYVTRGITLRQRYTDYKPVPHFKLRSLDHLHTYLTSCMINITIKRACQFTTIYSFIDPELSLKAFIDDQGIHAFFFKPETLSPLDSIPTYQSIQLINYFFDNYPFHILLNKTKLLQDYWNDSVEPLLLCVIYGIATYAFQHSMGKPFDAHRNAFLDYAYVLMERFFTKRDKSVPIASLGKYQAAVLLGFFEILFGLPKHGMTIMSVSYMMAAELGIFNHNHKVTDGVIDSDTIDNKSGPKTIHALDPVDRELLINTYWGALRCTAYGCLELGLYLRDTLLFHGQPFPAANGNTSASFQLDAAHNNHTASSAHLIESFHAEMVLTYFSTKMFACLPRTEYNIFGGKAYQGVPPTDREQEYLKEHGVIQYQNTVSINSVVDAKVQLVLKDFSDFIVQEKYQWSFLQSYMIQTAYYMYSIHFSFTKPRNVINPLRYQTILNDLNLADPRVNTRIMNLQPSTMALVTLLQTFLQQVDDQKLYNPHEDYTTLLPYSLMSAVLETVVQITIYQYQLGLDIFEQTKSMHDILKHPVFWIPEQQVVTKMIEKRLKEFIRMNQIPVAEVEELLTPEFSTPEFNMATTPEYSMPASTMPTTSDSMHLGVPMFFMDNSQISPDLNAIDPITTATASINLNGHDPTLLQDIDNILNSFDSLY